MINLNNDGLEMYKRIEYKQKKKQINESYTKLINNINNLWMNFERWKY